MPLPPDRSLLPAGLQDTLPPDADREAALVERLMAGFAAWGYARVKPPLVEFEESLLTGVGRAVAKRTFRLMDPLTQRMMGLRADMTLQVARIAASRLAHAPRPLRLCYTGEVLRIAGSDLRPERQFRQVGGELVGSLAAESDAELIALGAELLAGAGVARASVDLTVPTLVPALLAAHGLAGEAAEATRLALDRQDAAAVAALPPPLGGLLAGLLAAVGPAGRAAPALAALDLPEAAEPDRRRLLAVLERLAAVRPELRMTLDPVERRGFEYQSGLSVTWFADGVRGELGRGGRYRIGAEPGEPAVGLTLYTDTLLRAVPAEPPPPLAYLPWGTEPATAEALRGAGWRCVAALAPEPGDDAVTEAARLRCTHIARGGAVAPLPEPKL